jgi:predicted MFS family arabinose efflux permease
MSSTDKAARTPFSSYQKFVVALLAFLQFTIVLDFMLLSPLGAVLMPSLHISPAQFGALVSSYAFAAGIAGVSAAGFADRFDRKNLLLVFYTGFIAGTLLCGLAQSYQALLIARTVTGLFSGVVGAVCFAIITDLFPMEMRGRVMGITQTAFAASSVLGLPISLALSSRFTWNAPFFLIVAVCLLVGGAALIYLKPVNAHLKLHPERSPLVHLAATVSNPRYIQGFVTTGLTTLGGFMLMPFVSAFNVHNVGISFSSLPIVYLVSGLCAAGAGPLIGRASDSFGKFRVFTFGCAMTMVMVVIYTNMTVSPIWVLILVTVLFQVGIFSRMIASSALMSGVPAASDRGAYMAITSSLQQVAGGVAAVVAGQIVVEQANGSLLHFNVLGYALVVTTLASLWLLARINSRLNLESKVKSQKAVSPEPVAEFR